MKTQDTIFELVISKTKEGKTADFAKTRANLITELSQTEGFQEEGSLQSFFTADKNLHPQDIQIGIIKWKSEQAFGQAIQPLIPGNIFKNYTATFDSLVFLKMQPEDGQDFDIGSITKKGQVVEFAVRETKTGQETAFAEKHHALLDKIAQNKGFMFEREFVVPGEKTRAVITVWESMEDFKKAGEILLQSKEFADFMALIDLKTFQVAQVKS